MEKGKQRNGTLHGNGGASIACRDFGARRDWNKTHVVDLGCADVGRSLHSASWPAVSHLALPLHRSSISQSEANQRKTTQV